MTCTPLRATSSATLRTRWFAAARTDEYSGAPGVALAPDALVIAADTTVDLGGEILAKPDDAAHAADMLRRLSARTHRVQALL